jgi:CRISPR/Cas system-associated endonuclease Cas1
MFSERFHESLTVTQRIGRQKVEKADFEYRPRDTSGHLDNSHAADPLNVLLNYQYGILGSKMRTNLGSNGLSCDIGFLHTFSDNRKELLCQDFKELGRSFIDDTIIDFLPKVSEKSFKATKDYRLFVREQTAKRFLQLLGERLNRKLEYKNKKWKISGIWNDYARTLAKALLQKEIPIIEQFVRKSSNLLHIAIENR